MDVLTIYIWRSEIPRVAGRKVRVREREGFGTLPGIDVFLVH
jgi:hypothetical protein